MWGINAYRGISFYDLFDEWEARSDRPMFMAEYGARYFENRSFAFIVEDGVANAVDRVMKRSDLLCNDRGFNHDRHR